MFLRPTYAEPETRAPTLQPTRYPTKSPTEKPTRDPTTAQPTDYPIGETGEAGEGPGGAFGFCAERRPIFDSERFPLTLIVQLLFESDPQSGYSATFTREDFESFYGIYAVSTEMSSSLTAFSTDFTVVPSNGLDITDFDTSFTWIGSSRRRRMQSPAAMMGMTEEEEEVVPQPMSSVEMYIELEVKDAGM